MGGSIINQGNRNEVEKLQHRIECLVDIQETIRATLEASCTQEERAMLEGLLRRHKSKEEMARQELAALK